MNRKKEILVVFVFTAAILACMGGCDGTGSYKIRRVEVPMSEVFYIDSKAMTDQAVNDSNNNKVGTLKGSSWMEEDENGNWIPVYNTGNQSNYNAGGPGGPDSEKRYRGIRLTGIDQTLITRQNYVDASAFDGIVFKHKSNSVGTIWIHDKSYRFSAKGRVYVPHGYIQNNEAGVNEATGVGDPDIPYKEVIIPFSNVSRAPVIVNQGTDDNNPEGFDRDFLTKIMFDCRQPEDSINGIQSPRAWSEIVDFAFFVYE